MSGMNIRVGHVARHTPRGAGAQGREAAVVDIAQDLLLATCTRAACWTAWRLWV